MAAHRVTWTTPQPLWPEATAPPDPAVERDPIRPPAILRFTTDDFMPEFMNVAATDPLKLGQYRLVKETWRGVIKLDAPTPPKKVFALPFQRLGVTRQRQLGRASALPVIKPKASSDTDGTPLKLYQPAHQRFYLVTACLVCQTAGLPDRKVDPARQEQAGFVLRRLLPPNPDPASPPAFDAATWEEHAWIPKPGGNVWQKADPPEQFVEGEELQPMFALNYTQDDRRQRRLFAGLVPAGKREAYLAATRASSAAAGGTDITARKILFRIRVSEPWKQLVDRAKKMELAAVESPGDPKPSDDQKKAARNTARVELQAAAYYTLVDFADYLRTYLLPVWDALLADTPASQLSEPSQRDLLNALRNIGLRLPNVIPAGGGLRSRWLDLAGSTQTLHTSVVDLFKALAADARIERRLNETTDEFQPSKITAPAGYPPFLFPLADPEFPDQAALPPSTASTPPLTSGEQEELTGADDDAVNRIDKLTVLVARALATADPNVPQPAIPLAAQQPADALTGWFVIRCVYRRPACGPLHDDVVSPRTAAFQLAGFFDPDAPARPIRIGLPVDTTPAGLRKFDKNTAFVLSDTLCGQVRRMQGITFGDLVRSVLPWPLHKDLPSGGGACKAAGGVPFGTICSLSIPIITICALILLIIMVTLLDLIFHWLPFFMVCFPVKGLKAK